MIADCRTSDKKSLIAAAVATGRTNDKRVIIDYKNRLYAMLLIQALLSVLFLSFTFLTLVNARTCCKEDVAAAVRRIDVNEANKKVNGCEIGVEYTTPIIGVLSQEVSRLILRKYPGNNFTSYIAASYVKFVEGAGGRVVPIWIGQSRDYYEDIMSKINGVLMPGGATFFNQSDGYADAGKHIYEIAIDMNKRGIYMPVWGTCLGFELMVYLTANGTEPRTDCASSKQALPLEFKADYKASRLFQNASDEIINIFKNQPVTANFHMYCFTEETFADMKLNETWRVMSLNHDWNGQEFISTAEHKQFPFYGVQFHPEKNLYEFIPNRNITHSSQAVRTSQYFADFFVGESRRNCNRFSNRTEETKTLIYNYKPEYTGATGSAFVQQYLFEGERSGAMRSVHELLFGVICLSALVSSGDISWWQL